MGPRPVNALVFLGGEPHFAELNRMRSVLSSGGTTGLRVRYSTVPPAPSADRRIFTSQWPPGDGRCREDEEVGGRIAFGLDLCQVLRAPAPAYRRANCPGYAPLLQQGEQRQEGEQHDESTRPQAAAGAAQDAFREGCRQAGYATAANIAMPAATATVQPVGKSRRSHGVGRDASASSSSVIVAGGRVALRPIATLR